MGAVMLTTKRYEYLHIDSIRCHPDVGNHRSLNEQKVAHYATDILQHGLLEPLVVWEKKPGEYYLVGGFHRLAAIERIRQDNPGYFDNIDVRVVAADLDEIRALNLKLNADRLDTKITDYFETVIHLNNVNWTKERIADFLDRSAGWIEDIIRFAPIMPPDVRARLESGALSWERAKRICRAVRDAEAGQEREILAKELGTLDTSPRPVPKRPLTFRSAKSRLGRVIKRGNGDAYSVSPEQLMSLLLVLEGRHFDDDHLAHVRRTFPGLLVEDLPRAAEADSMN